MQCRAEGHGADDHAEQQHDIHQSDDLGLRSRRRQIGGERQADGLHRVQARPYEQKCDARPDVSDPDRVACGFAPAREHQQGEGHDGEAAKLHHGAAKDEGHPPPPKGRLMGVRLETDERAKGREKQRQGNHHADKRRRHFELDNHHPIERAHQQHERHADRHLKHGKAQEPSQRQLSRRHVREGQEAGAKAHPCVHEFQADAVHDVSQSFRGHMDQGETARPLILLWAWALSRTRSRR